jgi:RNA-binding protein NOB1
MISTLVLDANAFINGSYTHLAERFVTTNEVLQEIKDKRSKTALDASPTAIDLRQPTSDAVLKVTAFAKATGDLSVLSQTDLRLCALLLTLEVESNGYHRVRPSLGQLSAYEQEREVIRQQRRERRKAKSAARPRPEPTPVEAVVESPKEASEEPEEAPEEEDSDSDAGEWITPENIASFKASSSTTVPASTEEEDAENLSTALLTSDYAMQNVVMQMGLNVVGTSGLKIKEIKTWILRCHACFK